MYANFKKILFSTLFIFSVSFIYAQQAPGTGVKYDKKQKKEVWKPENTQQKVQEESDKDKEEAARQPKTKRGKSRKIKRMEKRERKDYYAHQNRIQTPEVRYRMNKNEKKAKKQNDHKRPGFFKRLGRKMKFNKRKVKR